MSVTRAVDRTGKTGAEWAPFVDDSLNAAFGYSYGNVRPGAAEVNALTATLAHPTGLTTYQDGAKLTLLPTNNNTDVVTLDLGLGAWSVRDQDGALLAADALVANRAQPCVVDGPNSYFRFDGPAAQQAPADGAWIDYATTGMDDTPGSTLVSGAGYYGGEGTTAPVATHNGYKAVTTLAFQASKTTTLRFTIQGTVSVTYNTTPAAMVVGLFRDSEASAIEWSSLLIPNIGTFPAGFTFIFEVACDALPHTYSVHAKSYDATHVVNGFTRLRISVEELA